MKQLSAFFAGFLATVVILVVSTASAEWPITRENPRITNAMPAQMVGKSDGGLEEITSNGGAVNVRIVGEADGGVGANVQVTNIPHVIVDSVAGTSVADEVISFHNDFNSRTTGVQVTNIPHAIVDSGSITVSGGTNIDSELFAIKGSIDTLTNDFTSRTTGVQITNAPTVIVDSATSSIVIHDEMTGTCVSSEVMVQTTSTPVPATPLVNRRLIKVQNLGPNPDWCSCGPANPAVGTTWQIPADPGSPWKEHMNKDACPLRCVASANQVTGAATIVMECR